MKNKIKNTIFLVLTMIRAHHFFRMMNRKKFIILLYHGVLKQKIPVSCWWQLPFEKFKWQLEYLKKHYTVMHLRDVIDKVQRGEHLPDNVAVITFDDGFENNYSVAYPLLQELNLPATIFLTTDFIGTDQMLWPDKLLILFLETKVQEIDLRNFALGILDLSSKEAKQKSFNLISNQLKALKIDKKKELISYIESILSKEKIQVPYSDNFKLLSWEQVDFMNETGLIHWGAHTCTHEILSNLDDSSLEDEIQKSCCRISSYGNNLLFAYPNGSKRDFDERAKVILQKLNVLCALTTISGLNSHFPDAYELKRIDIDNNMTENRFKLLCSGAFR